MVLCSAENTGISYLKRGVICLVVLELMAWSRLAGAFCCSHRTRAALAFHLEGALIHLTGFYYTSRLKLGQRPAGCYRQTVFETRWLGDAPMMEEQLGLEDKVISMVGLSLKICP